MRIVCIAPHSRRARETDRFAVGRRIRTSPTASLALDRPCAVLTTLQRLHLLRVVAAAADGAVPANAVAGGSCDCRRGRCAVAIGNGIVAPSTPAVGCAGRAAGIDGASGEGAAADSLQPLVAAERLYAALLRRCRSAGRRRKCSCSDVLTADAAHGSWRVAAPNLIAYVSTAPNNPFMQVTVDLSDVACVAAVGRLAVQAGAC